MNRSYLVICPDVKSIIYNLFIGKKDLDISHY